jgi:hypothetical protein
MAPGLASYVKILYGATYGAIYGIYRPAYADRIEGIGEFEGVWGIHFFEMVFVPCVCALCDISLLGNTYAHTHGTKTISKK